LPPKPVHLALFTRSLSGGGGAERVLVHLAGALADQGARVDVVLAHARGPFLAEIPRSVRIVDLGAPPARAALPDLLKTPGDARALLPVLFASKVTSVLGAIRPLAHYLRETSPGALLSLMDYSNVTALLARRGAGVATRIAVSVHNHVSASVRCADRMHTRRLPLLVRRFYPEADAVVAVSNGVADDLVQVAGLPRERVHRIYNPVLIPEIADLALEPLEHPAFADDVPVVLGVGKLKKQKDFENLIRAFALVRRRRPARLVILGRGKRHRGLLALGERLGVADDLHLPGFTSNPYPYMARASVFVLSSRYEGFGNVLVEAMACGCPVVSTDCQSGPSEILENGRYGRLTAANDPEGLASAICATLDDAPVRSELEKRAGEFTAAASAIEYRRLLLGG
jgi:glycosyltransferase involved in cell wall biosynthesis